MTIPLTSDAYVLAAAEALKQAGKQALNPPGRMREHAHRAAVLLDMARLLAEREAAQLALPEPPLPAAFLDCHDRRWEQMGSRDTDYYLSGHGPESVRHIDAVRESFGPLREMKS